MDKKLTEVQEKFLDLLFEDGIPDNIFEKTKDVKERAGYNYKTPNIQILRGLIEEITKRHHEFLMLEAGPSVKALQSVVKTPTLPGADNIIKASNSILDRAGIGKKEQHEVEIKADKGIVILPAKK